MDRIWRTCANRPLPVRYWDGDYVVYNPLSGNTHVLDVLVGEVLKTIIAGSTGERALRAHMASFLEVPDDERVRENLDAILSALDGLGLIEAVAPC